MSKNLICSDFLPISRKSLIESNIYEYDLGGFQKSFQNDGL